MKKEISYFAWNAFLVLSVLSARFLGAGFALTIVGWFAGIELAVWIFTLFCMNDRAVRKGLRKALSFKWYTFMTEASIVTIAYLCGYYKLTAAWIMIVALMFYLSMKAQSKKEEDEAEDGVET